MNYFINNIKINKHRGLAAVETTIVMPILLLLIFCVSEFGRAFYTYNTLNKTVQDGARMLASLSKSNTEGNIVFDNSAPDGNAYIASNLIIYGSEKKSEKSILQDFRYEDLSFEDLGSGMALVTANYTYNPMIGNFLSPYFFKNTINLQFSMKASVTIKVLQ